MPNSCRRLAIAAGSVIEPLEIRTMLSTWTVSNVSGSGSGSFPAAVQQADAAGGNQTIVFASSLTAQASANINLHGINLTIQPASGILTIQGSTGLHAIILNFNGSGGINTGGQSEIDDLTIENASNSGITNTGILTLNDCTITGSTAGAAGTAGGGINNDGNLTLSQTTVSDNVAYNAGGIANYGDLTIAQSTITGNATGGRGGGVANYGTLSVKQSTFSANYGDIGGAINNADSAQLTITSSTITGNISGVPGGGILNLGYATVVDSTIAGNTAFGYGGGIGNYGPAVTLEGTIIAGNIGVNGDEGDLYGPFTGTGNLIGDGTGGLTDPSNIQPAAGENTIDPMLAPLGNYGGPTETMPPLPGSPAIGAGSTFDDASGNPINTDERGFPIDTTSDIGAFQTQPNPLEVNATDDGPGSPGELSLRDAVNLADALGGDETITFTPALTAFSSANITVGASELDLNDTTGTLTIDGTGCAYPIIINLVGSQCVVDANSTATLNGLAINGTIADDGILTASDISGDASINVGAGALMTLPGGSSLPGGTVAIGTGGTLINASAINLSTALSNGLVLNSASTLVNQGTLSVSGNLNLGQVDLQNQGTMNLGTSGSISGGGTYTPVPSTPYSYSIPGGTISGTNTNSGSEIWSYSYTPTNWFYNDNSTVHSSYTGDGSFNYFSNGSRISGNISESGSSTFCEQLTSSATLQNGAWTYSGSDTQSSSDQGSWTYSDNGSFFGFLVGGIFWGTTTEDYGENWTDTGSANYTLNSQGSWTLDSGSTTSAESTYDDLSNSGHGNFSSAGGSGSFSGIITEGDSIQQSETSTIGHLAVAGQWTVTGSASSLATDNGTWYEGGNGTYSDLIDNGIIFDTGTDQASEQESWSDSFSTASTLNPDGSWSTTGNGNSDDSTSTNFSYGGGGSGALNTVLTGSQSGSINENDTYSEGGSQTASSDVSSNWVLDPSGSWRAATTQITDSGEDKSNCNFTSELAENITAGTWDPGQYTTDSAIGESSDYSFNDNLTIATDVNGATTLSGTGSGTGSASGSESDHYTDNYLSLPYPAFIEKDDVQTQDRYSYTGGWSEDYSTGIITSHGSDAVSGNLSIDEQSAPYGSPLVDHGTSTNSYSETLDSTGFSQNAYYGDDIAGAAGASAPGNTFATAGTPQTGQDVPIVASSSGKPNEHRTNKRPSNWNKHSAPRAGGPEKKDQRMKFSPKGGKNPNTQKQVVVPPASVTIFDFSIGPNGVRQLVIAGKVVATGLAAYALLAAIVAAAPAGG